jgi:DNA-binding ferritin-like protein
MKTLIVTYESMVLENGEKHYGEACMDIPMMDDIAERLIETGESGIAVAQIETILSKVELLRGRHYIKDSIKDYRELAAE